MDIPVIMGIAVTKSVIICCAGVAFTLFMLIVLLITLSNGKAKEKRMIESAVNSKPVRTARSKVTSQPVIRNVRKPATSAPQSEPKDKADDLTMAVNEAESVSAEVSNTSALPADNTAELQEDTAALPADNTAELTENTEELPTGEL
jgi:hypothetical protein